MKSVLGGYPAPNSYTAGDGLNTGTYQWNSPFSVRGPQYLVRIDHNINRQAHPVRPLAGRGAGYAGRRSAQQPAAGAARLSRARRSLPAGARTSRSGLRSVLSPRLVNELTLGYLPLQFLFTQGEANPLFPNTPRFTFNNSDVDYTANPRTFRAVNMPQIVENMSYVTGAHVFRFGVNMRFYQHNDQRGDVGGTSLTPAISLSRTTRPPAGFTLPALAPATTAGIAATDLNRLQGTINDLLGIPAVTDAGLHGRLSSDTFLPFQNGEKAVTLVGAGPAHQAVQLLLPGRVEAAQELHHELRRALGGQPPAHRSRRPRLRSRTSRSTAARAR